MGSSRLKEKIFLKINGVLLIEHLLKRVKKIKHLNRIIISTTDKPNDDKLIKFLKKKRVYFFRGSEDKCP